MDLMLLCGAWSLLLLCAAYFLPQMKELGTARLLAWGIVLLTAPFSLWICRDQPSLIRMFLIVWLQLLAMKIPVMVESYRGLVRLNWLQLLAFSLGWFGMRPGVFESLPSKPLVGVRALFNHGVSRIALGFCLLYGAQALELQQIKVYYLPELLMLAGLSFILHFGMLDLAAALWRQLGVNVRALFQSPYLSGSLQEFWGKRWNLAFSEMTALIAFRPLKKRIGNDGAMLLSFLLSGLLHELAISFPVNSGYGLPMTYFVLHGGAMYAEKSSPWVQQVILRPFWSHVWVMAWLILPMPLLFHEGFMVEVVRPLCDILLLK